MAPGKHAAVASDAIKKLSPAGSEDASAVIVGAGNGEGHGRGLRVLVDAAWGGGRVPAAVHIQQALAARSGSERLLPDPTA